MKKLLTISMLFTLFISYAQELKTVKFNESDIAKDLILSKNWNVSLNDLNINISQGRITNKLGVESRNLKLTYYISNNLVELTTGEFQGFLLSEIPIRPITRNGSIIGINIESRLSSLPIDGNYFQTLVLSDDNGNVKDILQLPMTINVQNNSIALVKPKEDIVVVDTVEVITETETDFSGVTDPNLPLNLIVSNSELLSLSELWTVEIDWINWAVMINGGKIKNNQSTNSGKLFLDVYLVKEKLQNPIVTFNGFHVATALIRDTMFANTTSSNITVKTNLRAIVPQGDYYILLTLSEEINGEKKVVSFRNFSNKVTL